MSTPVTCEAKRECDQRPCTHPAKYLAPYRSLAVCGIHARGLLNCIPLAEFDQPNTAGIAAAYEAARREANQ